MADISIDYSSMEVLQKLVLELKDQFETMQNTVKTDIASLEGNWKGNAQKDFFDAYDEIEPQLKTIMGVLTRFSREVETTAQGIHEVDTSQQKGFQPITYPTF